MRKYVPKKYAERRANIIQNHEKTQLFVKYTFHLSYKSMNL